MLMLNAGVQPDYLSTPTRNTAIYSGDGLKKISRTSTCPRVAATPFRAHATASSMSAHSKIQKPPICSLVSRYGP
jgi:hypothetical protein